MGMVLQLKCASDGDIGRLMAQPKSIHRFLYPEEVFDNELADDKNLSAKVMSFFRKPAPVEAPVVFDVYDLEEFDMDKAWHGLYFLLTDCAANGDGPAADLLECVSIGDEDLGYGPAQAIGVARTKILSDYLNRLDRVEVLARFDPIKMTQLGIYPSVWDREDERELLLEWLGSTFDELRDYCRACTDRGLGMVSWMS